MLRRMALNLSDIKLSTDIKGNQVEIAREDNTKHWRLLFHWHYIIISNKLYPEMLSLTSVY